METPPEGHAHPRRGARIALPVAVLIGAIAVVALAASQRSASATGPGGARLASAVLVDAGLLLIALYCLAAAAILLLSLPEWKRGKHGPGEPELVPPSLGSRRRDLLLLLLPPLVLGSAIALLAAHVPNLGAGLPPLGPGLTGSPPSGGLSSGPTPAASHAASPLLLQPTLFIAFAAFVVAAVSLVAWLLNGGGPGGRARRRSGPWGMLVALLFAALAATLNNRRGSGTGAGALPGSLPGAAPTMPGAPLAPHVAPPAGGDDWLALLIVLALFLGVVAVVAVRRRVRRAPPIAAASATMALAAALDSSLDELRRETDPRRAVIRAYAALEYALAARGLPRRVAEAPFEYLARAWQRDDAADAGRRLTLLFERARFGRQPITAAMQADAIDALEHLRALLDELEPEGAIGRAP